MGNARLVFMGTLLAAVQLTAWAQQPKAFEVVSIKRNTSGDNRARVGAPPGRFEMVNMPIRTLITSAYPADTSEFEGGPSWLATDAYDVAAKMPEGSTRADLEPMLQTLLAERFMFKGHYETREAPIYHLVLARSDGTLGPGVTKLDVDCAARTAARARGETVPELPRLPNGMLPCSMSMGGGELSSGGMTMARLAGSIQGSTGRVLVDKTGLTGDYAFTLRYTSNPGPDSAQPSIFTALQEQLGLRLESARGPVRHFVVDRIERPTED
jgi:uncharacterized protein (TIGR03435 family)